MTFEESYANLEKIKQSLENPETSFDEAVKLYGESVKWTKNCLDILNDCEGKISVIKAEIDGLVEKPLDMNEE